MASRLRHIAIIVPDPEKAATFFEQAFGMTRAGSAMRGVSAEPVLTALACAYEQWDGRGWPSRPPPGSRISSSTQQPGGHGVLTTSSN